MSANIPYTRNSFINNYNLTREEFNLMPEEMQDSYSSMMCTSIINFVNLVNHEVEIDDGIDSMFASYFSKCGIELVEKEVDGKMTTIARCTSSPISNHLSTCSEIVKRHINYIGQAKAQIFEEKAKKLLNDYLLFLTTGTPVELERLNLASILSSLTSLSLKELNLDEEQRDYLVHHELLGIMEYINAYQKASLPLSTPDIYLDYLRRRGYIIKEDAEELIISVPTVAKSEKALAKTSN